MTPEHQQAEREALKGCPHCGAPASGHAIEPHSHSLVFNGVKMPDHPGSYVIEGDCACGSGLIGDTQEEVTARWNRRAGERADVGPPGMVLVPVGPTPEMLLAANAVVRSIEADLYTAEIQQIYKAMVAASQDSAKGGK